MMLRTSEIDNNPKPYFMRSLQVFLVSLFLVTLSSCEVVGGIFKAGVGVGIFAVVAVVAVIIFIVAKIGGK